MKAYEIKFPVNFESDEAGPLHLGRLYLGVDQSIVARVFFDTKGALCIAIPQSAIDTRAVIVYPDPPLDEIFGLGACK